MGGVNNRGINPVGRICIANPRRSGEKCRGGEITKDPGGGKGKVFSGGLRPIVRTEYRIFILCQQSPRDIRG